MAKTKILVTLFLIIAALASGCINELVPVDEQAEGPDLSAYEFEVFVNESDNISIVNTTTFYLSDNESTKVVRMVQNTSIIETIPIESIGSSNQDSLTNIVLLADYANSTDTSVETFTRYSLAENASNISYNLEDEVSGGQKHTILEFDGEITGFVAYTIPQQTGQSFIHTQTSPTIVRFVLPEGFATGNRAIGTARPEPDLVYHDDKDRENLVWYSPEEDETITIKYYSTSAPRSLLIISSILAVGVAIVLADYYRSKQKLKRKREMIEQANTKGRKKS